MIQAEYAFPCATQNEINLGEAEGMIKNGLKGVFEGANMPCENPAIDLINEHQLLFAPAKAANAGGVAISAIEMSQNSMGMSWKRDEVDAKLKEIMQSIHQTCVKYGKKGDRVCYQTGANIGGFVKVADAMLAFGIN